MITTLEENLNRLADIKTLEELEKDIQIISFTLTPKGTKELIDCLSEENRSYFILKILREEWGNQIRERNRKRYIKDFIDEHFKMITILKSIDNEK